MCGGNVVLVLIFYLFLSCPQPNNVLLNEDGHIQLVDLGGVADEAGLTLGQKQEAQGLVPLFTQHFINKKTGNYTQVLAEPIAEEPETVGKGHKKPPPIKRKLSIMGTFG
jgi:hypothetical protein